MMPTLPALERGFSGEPVELVGDQMPVISQNADG